MRVANFDDALDELTKKYEQLQAHAANLEQRFSQKDFPIQTFGRTNRYPNPCNQLDPADQQSYQNQRQQDYHPRQDRPGGRYNPDLPNQGVCFRCGKPGHFRSECRSQPLPYNEHRNQVNTIQETYLSDESDEDEDDTIDFNQWSPHPADRRVREPTIKLASHWPEEEQAYAYPVI